MRLFGGNRIQGIMETLKIDEDTPIDAKMLSGSIEGAQRKVEGRNFETRKSVLRFDDVMNQQREIIYGQRGKVLEGEDISEYIANMRRESVEKTVDIYLANDESKNDWNLDGLRDYYLGWMLTDGDLRFTKEEYSKITKAEITEILQSRMEEIYSKREEMFTPEIMRELERVALLKNVDLKWMDHIDAMSDLKQGIYLRSYAQHDPVVEYRIEGFDMFDQMIEAIREDTVKMLMTVRVRTAPQREQVAVPVEASGDGSVSATVVKKKKVGRNDPCPCGSGKKYKHCCGK